MRSQIRLADRQGLLQGRHISPVQTKSLIVLNYLDDIDRHKQNDLALRRALLTREMSDPAKLFPEELGEPKKKEIDAADPDDVHYDYSEVTWKSGQDAYAEYEQLMAKIGSAQSGIVTGEMMTEPEWTKWG